MAAFRVIGYGQAVLAQPRLPDVGRIDGDDEGAAQQGEGGDGQPDAPLGREEREQHADREHENEVAGHHAATPPRVGQIMTNPVEVLGRQPETHGITDQPNRPWVAGKPGQRAPRLPVAAPTEISAAEVATVEASEVTAADVEAAVAAAAVVVGARVIPCRITGVVPAAAPSTAEAAAED
jgi:hypothetical protein